MPRISEKRGAGKQSTDHGDKCKRNPVDIVEQLIRLEALLLLVAAIPSEFSE
jgi:hypothetical protein